MFMNQEVLAGMKIHFYDINSGKLFLKGGIAVIFPFKKNSLTEVKSWAVSQSHVQPRDLIMLT
jgi:hypothetical protein